MPWVLTDYPLGTVANWTDTLHLICPRCGRHHRVDSPKNGQAVTCQRCGLVKYIFKSGEDGGTSM